MHLPRVMNVKRITTSWDRKSLSLTQLSGNHLFWVKNGPSTKCWRLMSYLGKDPLIIDCRYFHLHITNTSVLLGQISVAITFKRFSFFVSVQLSLWAVNRKHCTLNCLMLIIVTLLIFLKLDWALGYSCHGPILVSWPHTTSVPFSFPCPRLLTLSISFSLPPGGMASSLCCWGTCCISPLQMPAYLRTEWSTLPFPDCPASCVVALCCSCFMMCYSTCVYQSILSSFFALG